MAEKFNLAIVVMDDGDSMKDCPDNTLCLMTYDGQTDFSSMEVNGEYAAEGGSALGLLSCITAMRICCKKAMTLLINKGVLSAADDVPVGDFIDGDDD